MMENRMSTPTLINLPPPPSDPVTPSDMGPGTPNSGTTSLSALSTTAIKDGHQGHPHPYARHAHHSSSASATSTSTLEAERADRISRLAGLERIATARAGGVQNAIPGSGVAAGGTPQNNTHTVTTNNNSNTQPYSQGYFDSYPQLLKERSTVGSASATGSIGGRTTWASSSDAYFDPDKMSEEHDNDEASSVGGMSEEGNASLVGFGEGANSTISGPISSARFQTPSTSTSSNNATSNIGRMPSFGSPGAGARSSSGIYPISSHFQQQQHMPPSPAGSNTPEPFDDARMVDGMTYDPDVVDTTVRTPRLADGKNDRVGSE